MFKNYFKIAWRNLWKNKVYSIINILGLALGLAIALLIGLWIWDEVSFNKNFTHYDRIVSLFHNSRDNNQVATYPTVPYPLAAEMRNKYTTDYKEVALAKDARRVLAVGENQIGKKGFYAEQSLMDILSVKMLRGTAASLSQPGSLLLSASAASSLFGNADPINKIVKINNKRSLQVTGVYADFPASCDFHGTDYFMPWENIMLDMEFAKNDIERNNWGDNSYFIYAQLQDNTLLQKAAANIRNALNNHGIGGEPNVVLQPMSNWHLYGQFKNGVNVGGAIQFVYMFGIIGLFVLILACINFMNLSTARSEKRAKEVGIRKSSGSLRTQLIAQFLVESIIVSGLAMVMALLIILLALPWFNQLADKQMHLPWSNSTFWATITIFTVLTGIVAGSYPAFYLSGFNTIKVLKGTFKLGRFSSLPRKVLVVLQFTVSVALVIGTVIIYQQIRFTQNRPVGYNRDGLLRVNMNTPDLYAKYDALRNDLLQSGAATNMAESSSPTTDVWANWGGFSWEGMPADMQPQFGVISVTTDYGKTVDWKMAAGRDFSKQFATDDHAIILNESAVKYMNISDPVGKIIRWPDAGSDDKNFRVIGVVKNVIMESPFAEVKPALFMMDPDQANVILIRLNASMSAHQALPVIENVFKKYNPHAPFDYSFVDEEYASKFSLEERIGSLAAIFTALAAFISCLGLFGLASFIAVQRTKEIGVRKILGASILNVWGLLSKDFVMLVLLASALAVPAAYFGMQHWLAQYEYHTSVSLLVFVMSTAGALAITLLTVSFQAIKAAVVNPVKSLRSE